MFGANFEFKIEQVFVSIAKIFDYITIISVNKYFSDIEKFIFTANFSIDFFGYRVYKIKTFLTVRLFDIYLHYYYVIEQCAWLYDNCYLNGVGNVRDCLLLKEMESLFKFHGFMVTKIYCWVKLLTKKINTGKFSWVGVASISQCFHSIFSNSAKTKNNNAKLLLLIIVTKAKRGLYFLPGNTV